MNIVSYLAIFVGLLGAHTEAAFVGSSVLEEITADVIGSLPLVSNSQMQFMGNISIGSPAQNLTVLFDISATNLTIYATKILQNPSITYTNRPLVGAMSANSSVNIAGLNITAQEFVISLSSDASSNVAGVFGLGYTAQDANGMSSPLYNIIANNLISQQLFSLQLLLTADTDNTQAGALLLGSVNSSLQSNQPIYADNSNISDWQFNVDASFINGSSTGTGNVQLSSSTMSIAVPDAIYQNLTQYIQVQVNDSGYYGVLCDLVEPLFVFIIGDSNLTLYAADFMTSGINAESSSGSICVFVVENSGSDVWRLGTPFMAKYYTIFDIAGSRIGFVDTNNTSTPEETSTTTTTTSESTTTPSTISTTTEDSGNAAVGSFAWTVYQKVVVVFVVLFLLK